jgi:GNAT superfamily N-acetyltransferase
MENNKVSAISQGAFAVFSSDCYPVIEIGPQYESHLLHLLLGLDPASRISRFSCVADDAYLRRHLQQAMTSAAWLGGILLHQRLRGLVEVYDVDCAGMVEVAFLVDQSWRRRRLGTALLNATIKWSTERDRTMLRMVFPARNWPMRELASSAHARLDMAFGEMIADIAVTPPDAADT